LPAVARGRAVRNATGVTPRELAGVTSFPSQTATVPSSRAWR